MVAPTRFHCCLGESWPHRHQTAKNSHKHTLSPYPPYHANAYQPSHNKNNASRSPSFRFLARKWASATMNVTGNESCCIHLLSSTANHSISLVHNVSLLLILAVSAAEKITSLYDIVFSHSRVNILCYCWDIRSIWLLELPSCCSEQVDDLVRNSCLQLQPPPTTLRFRENIARMFSLGFRSSCLVGILSIASSSPGDAFSTPISSAPCCFHLSVSDALKTWLGPF